MRQPEMGLFGVRKGMLARFGSRVCQVLPQRLRLAMTEFGDFRVRAAIGMVIAAVPDDIVLRLCMPDQV
jgi:hypothetical protein